MNIESIIDSILEIPMRFNNGNGSPYSLLKKSGYFEYYDKIQEENILERLILYPAYIDSWLIWSGDKRTSSGWYFNDEGNEKYIVAYFPGHENLVQYSDIRKACAAFIKHEIEDIRT